MNALIQSAEGPAEAWCVMVDLPGIAGRGIYGLGPAKDAARFYVALIKQLEDLTAGRWERRPHLAASLGSPIQGDVSHFVDAGDVLRARIALTAVHDTGPERLAELLHCAEGLL